MVQRYLSSIFGNTIDPFIVEQEIEEPVYEVLNKDKKYRAFVEVENKYFSSESWEKNKRYAEQAAALVAISCLKVPEFVAKADLEQNTRMLYEKLGSLHELNVPLSPAKNRA